MNQVLECKQLHGQDVSIREISRRTGLARNTVSRYVKGIGLPGVYQMKTKRAQPARERIRKQVASLLEAEKRSDAPKKQRLTGARIWRLLEIDGVEACPRTVQELVREVRFEQRDALKCAYLPLAYEPGEDAQVDFYEGVVDDEKDGRVKVYVLLIRACFSGRCYAYAAPNLTREALLEGLMQALEFFGGVFRNLWFDNLTPAVRKVLKGRDRKRQEAFAQFEAHYGFKAQFCSPGKGNEKGGVEGEVRYSRHEILTPIPTVKGREGLQVLCDEWMVRDAKRKIHGRTETIAEQWMPEVPKLLPLPAARFEAASSRVAKVSSRSWVQMGTNYYSVPVDWVGREVIVRMDAERIRLVGARRGSGRAPPIVRAPWDGTGAGALFATLGAQAPRSGPCHPNASIPGPGRPCLEGGISRFEAVSGRGARVPRLCRDPPAMLGVWSVGGGSRTQREHRESGLHD